MENIPNIPGAASLSPDAKSFFNENKKNYCFLYINSYKKFIKINLN